MLLRFCLSSWTAWFSWKFRNPTHTVHCLFSDGGGENQARREETRHFFLVRTTTERWNHASFLFSCLRYAVHQTRMRHGSVAPARSYRYSINWMLTYQTGCIKPTGVRERNSLVWRVAASSVAVGPTRPIGTGGLIAWNNRGFPRL